MARKDVSDQQVCQVYADEASGRRRIDLLQRRTGQPEKVCWRAMERAFGRGLLDYGMWLQGGWLTEAGRALVGQQDGSKCKFENAIDTSSTSQHH
jgi:hypothetical protein